MTAPVGLVCHTCRGGVTLYKLLRLFPHTLLSWCFLRSLPPVRTETLSFLADGQWSGVDLDWDERRCPNTSGSLQDKHQAASQRLANTQSLGLYMETMEEISVCVCVCVCVCVESAYDTESAGTHAAAPKLHKIRSLQSSRLFGESLLIFFD